MNDEVDESIFNYDGIPFKIVALHIIVISSIFLIKDIKIYTVIYQFILYYLSNISATAAYHRLWSHNSYEASTPLQIFYLIFATMASQSSALWWAKAHRTHHRLEEQPGDPYNIKKGFYNAHIGWLVYGNDEKEKEEINKTSIEDLKKNKLLVFQHNYYIYLWILLFVISFMIPVLFWNESYLNSILSSFIRIFVVLHSTWMVNSWAHSCGTNYYNNNLGTCESDLVSVVCMGDGWHSYHHRYPKDYRGSEDYKYNPTRSFINFTKLLGLSSNHHIRGEYDIPVKERFNLKYYKTI